jgi:hypothetical protein
MSLDPATRGLAVPTKGPETPVGVSAGQIQRTSFESDILRDTDGDSTYSYGPTGGTIIGSAFVRYDPDQSAWDMTQIEVE